MVKNRSHIYLKSIGELELAIELGRTVFEHLRKFLQFQITCAVNLVLYVGFSVFFFETPSTSASNILWLNVLMDTIAAMLICSGIPE